jgi:dephospho-CoA kinase
MTKIIGLTGGMGSGKTTVANIFREFGVPVYIADVEARSISETDAVRNEIVRIFGSEITENDKIDRQKLAEIVFGDKRKLQELNNIIHPAVRVHFLNWVKVHSNFPFVIKEAAILFESGSDADCDAVITVTAPLERRIERIKKRDRIDVDEIDKRLENQWTDGQRMAKSTFVIRNEDIVETRRQVSEILKKLQNF